jgi:hypothetical protein
MMKGFAEFSIQWEGGWGREFAFDIVTMFKNLVYNHNY